MEQTPSLTAERRCNVEHQVSHEHLADVAGRRLLQDAASLKHASNTQRLSSLKQTTHLKLKPYPQRSIQLNTISESGTLITITTENNSTTQIDEKSLSFVSRWAMNIFRISTTVLSQIGRSEHIYNQSWSSFCYWTIAACIAWELSAQPDNVYHRPINEQQCLQTPKYGGNCKPWLGFIYFLLKRRQNRWRRRHLRLRWITLLNEQSADKNLVRELLLEGSLHN